MSIPMRLLLILHFLQLCCCTEFQVGEITGWVVPPGNHTQSQFYNHWASTKRFQIGDSIRFNYKKDSVMEVSQKDYNYCSSTRPSFFSNDGNTIYSLNRTGFFYFISGTAGHCKKGQRMVVWVIKQLDPAISPSPPLPYQYLPHLALITAAFHFF